MKSSFLTIALFLGLTASLFAQDLKTELETAYTNFTLSLNSKDTNKVKAALSSYSYRTIKNQMASSGASFPADFFKMAPMMIIDLKKFTFLKVLEKGPTANAIYWGKDNYGENALVTIKYVKENNIWKFNSMSQTSSDAIGKKIKAKDYSFLSESQYQPDGIVPVAPAEVKPSDYQAMLDIMCYGYEVSVTVNGVEQRGTKNGSISGTIIGGLKKGKNTIIITAKPTAGSEMSSVSVTIRALVNGAEKEVYTLDKDKPEASITAEFEMP